MRGCDDSGRHGPRLMWVADHSRWEGSEAGEFGACAGYGDGYVDDDTVDVRLPEGTVANRRDLTRGRPIDRSRACLLAHAVIVSTSVSRLHVTVARDADATAIYLAPRCAIAVKAIPRCRRSHLDYLLIH